MTRRRTRIVSIGVLTVAMVLTGCNSGTLPSGSSGDGSGGGSRPPGSSSDPTPASAASISRPAQGEAAVLPGGQVTGKSGGYTVTAPAGWGDATDQAGTQIGGLDLVLLSSKKVSRFSNNLVVIVANGDATMVRQKIETGRTRAAAEGREVSDVHSVQIAGVTAQGFTAKFEQKGVRITARSYGLAREGKVYLLTLSSSQDDAENALTAFEQITRSWTWT